MNGPQFFQTGMGDRFYNSTVPRIAAALEGIEQQLKRQNDLKEKEMAFLASESSGPLKTPADLASEFMTDEPAVDVMAREVKKKR